MEWEDLSHLRCNTTLTSNFIAYFFNPLSPKDIARSVVRILNKKKIKKKVSHYNYNNESIDFK